MLSFSSPEVVFLAVRRDQQGGGEVPQQVGVVLYLISGDINDKLSGVLHVCTGLQG